MNYQYIEQLIERYFAAETSVAEERILRAFFAESNVPSHLQQYASRLLEAYSLTGSSLQQQKKGNAASLTYSYGER